MDIYTMQSGPLHDSVALDIMSLLIRISDGIGTPLSRVMYSCMTFIGGDWTAIGTHLLIMS